MNEMVVGYHRLSDSEYAELWSKCTFIFDTNVLLNLYRHTNTGRNDMLRVMNAVKERVWLPHQVAVEFEERRLIVIAEQVAMFGKVRDTVTSAYARLKEDLGQMQLAKRHSVINPTAFLNSIESTCAKFIEEITIAEDKQPNVHEEDLIRQDIENIFSDKVGPPPLSQSELDTLYKEGADRYKLRQPPGYLDESKKSGKGDRQSYTYNGLTLHKKYGDLIIWKQILNHVKQAGLKHIIFVTDESGEDWW